MTPQNLTDKDLEFLKRTANILASTPWGAEYYRAQLAVIEEVQRLQQENAILLRFVPPALHPADGDPVSSLV